MLSRTTRIGLSNNLDQEKIDRIISAIPQVIIQAQVARFCAIPKQTLHDWLNWGERDLNACVESDYAKLALQYHETRAHVVRDLIFQLKNCPKNYQALTWILEKCFREDFGSESEEIRELKALFMQMCQVVPQLSKGVTVYAEAKELDPKGDKETGCAP